jgi:translation initiation factor IF-2
MEDKSKDKKKEELNTSIGQSKSGFSKILSLSNERKTVEKSQVKKIVNRAESITVEIKKRRGLAPLSNFKKEQSLNFSGLSKSDLTTKLNLIKNANASEKEAQIKKTQPEEVQNKTDSSQPNASNLSSVQPKKDSTPVADKKSTFKDKITPTIDHEKKLAEKEAVKAKPSFDRRRDSNRVIIQNISLSGEESPRGRSAASFRRKRDKIKKLHLQETQPKEKIIREIILPEYITVAELASRMAEKGADVVKKFLDMGMVITLNQTVDADTAELVVSELGHKVKRITEADVENILLDSDNAADTELSPRPPVVTVMGHIDHGKTSLLDALRSTDIISKETGGITQHIGAYQVQLKNGAKITFIDTPGHAVFTEMRLRGAMATDIVILVVAADDGVKDQTIEAISHAKAAKVPIIVAINKIDAVGANLQKVKTELLSHELIPEDMGGDIMTVEVSALKKKNLDKLEEAILFQADLLNLKASISGRARGVIIESKMDKSKGPIATLLIQNGTLYKGNMIVAGCSFGRVRTMIDYRGNELVEALPSTPVEITGLEITPKAGESFSFVQEEKQARDICEYRIRKQREEKEAKSTKSSLEELFKKSLADGSGTKELPVIIKADVQGSVEAISRSLTKLSTDKVKVIILHKAVGGINESDISLAKSSSAIILGFNVGATSNATKTAQHEGVEIRNYSIIYKLIDEVKLLMEGKLDTLKKEKFLGKAEIRQVFSIPKIGKVGGAFVTEGVVKRNAIAKLLRDNIIIYEGALKTLRRFKEDTKEVNSGYECGITLDKYDDIKEGDVVDVYEIIEEKDKL